MPRQQPDLQAGFTLIELMVVIALILVLTAIAVFIVPSMFGQQRASEGASQLQGWLLIAKGRALRDQAPRGIRLNIQAGNQFVTDLQYIEQPPDYGVNGSSMNGVSVGDTTVNFTGTNFTGGFANVPQYPVQPGDYLELKGGGPLYQIASVASPTQLTLTSAITSQVNATTQYRIIRQARILPGEDTLSLPQDVAIDLGLSGLGSTNIQNIQNGGGGHIPFTANATLDILFDRNGTVVGQAAAFDKIVLWVRDVTLAGPAANSPGEGDQSLITIYCRTNGLAGTAANFDANIGGGDWYYFTRDGRSPAQ
jgi:prepilin-type N-terminal cleavage/methylation domain-containing protein